MNLQVKQDLFIKCGKPTLHTLKSWDGVGYYLSTVLDDYSRYIVHWELCSNIVNQVNTYYFDIEKCKRCPLKKGCYKEGAKSKTYSVIIKSDIHKDQLTFQETDYFKEKAKHRYKIEAKNGELKNAHGFRRATSYGITNMQMQGAMAIFAVNLKRIIKLS